ncbi:MAG: hypothetical protein HQL80_12070 [Magnetococcales bacterium]|nr:hypothetical protein [Magnetococcales bacterium]
MSSKQSGQDSQTTQPAGQGSAKAVAATEAGVESIVAAMKSCYQQGQLEQTWALCEKLLSINPNHLEGLHYSSLIAMGRSEFAQAVERLDRALRVQPNHPVFLMNFGIALMGVQRLEEAFHALSTVVRLLPDSPQAHCHLGRVLLYQKKEGESALVLQKALQLAPEYALAHDLMAMALRSMKIVPLANYHKTLEAYFSKQTPMKPASPQHTLFLDREKAFRTALQANAVPETIQGSGLQVCYHFGAVFPDGPSNLVAVSPEPEAFVAFFSTKTFSDPTWVDFDLDSPVERAAAGRLARLLNDARIARVNAARQWAARCQESAPPFEAGRPMRVFVPTARQLDVMKHNSRDLARAFQRLGCDCLFYVEDDNRHTFDLKHYYEKLAQFNPHVVVDINDYFKLPLHPDVFKVAWFQDPMPCFMNGPFPWRKRDLIYSTNMGYDTLLYQSGVEKVRRQFFCYDEEIFRDFGHQRQRRVVVVASAHAFVYGRFPNCGPLLARMEAMFAAGDAMTSDMLDQLAAEYQYDRDDIYYYLWSHVVRIQSVRNLCAVAAEVGIEVEVYGHQWENDAVVRPFHKGPLPHGPAVAAVYNEALYVLISQQGLYSQRLVEVAACGAIPVIYDCRHRGEPFEWGHLCLWYRTKADIADCLTQIPSAPPHPIAQGSSYTDFARAILAAVDESLAAAGLA